MFSDMITPKWRLVVIAHLVLSWRYVIGGRICVCLCVCVVSEPKLTQDYLSNYTLHLSITRLHMHVIK